jgi:hypothetical protein
MLQHRRLPLPPRIEAIARLDKLEELSDRFERENGYAPELLSHWDPKPAFAKVISSWPRPIEDSASLVDYVYSSYLESLGYLQKFLSDIPERGYVLTPSGTSSLATVLTYLAGIGVRHLYLITPAYFAVEAFAQTLGISLTFCEVRRRGGDYHLPKISNFQVKSAIWITLPIYGTSCYISPKEVGEFIDRIDSRNAVIIDESLAYPDRNGALKSKTATRVIRIMTPNKALCINGEKVSIISCPKHLTTTLNDLADCLCGGIGASGLRALNFFAHESFGRAMTAMRSLVDLSWKRMLKVLQGSRHAHDKSPDGHFVMLYWPRLPMAGAENLKFMQEIVEASGALPIPASRNRHPAAGGFAFRVNLMRLDDAGLGALSRLARALDAHC